MKNALDLIAQKRAAQIAKGFTLEHDDEHREGELAGAGAFYACVGVGVLCGYDLKQAVQETHSIVLWPFDDAPPRCEGEAIDIYIDAAALLVAEIERLQRLAQKENTP